MAENGGHAPQISIVLPTHNRADVLVFAIRSVLWQTVQDFELLIVGDGCTDHTAAVVNSFADHRIRWFDLPKAPHFGYANRNVALRAARGACIAFMAHDDLWVPDHLELLSSCLDEHDTELAYSRPLWVEPDGMIMPGTFNLNHAETLELFLARKSNRIPAGCVLHRTECFAKCGYWNETLSSGGDWDMWVRIIESGKQRGVAYLAIPTNLHFQASWRRDADVWPPELRVWKALHAVEGLMPSALRIPVATGLTEQEAAWRIMSPDGQKWTRELRVAVDQVLDWRVCQSDELMHELLKRQMSVEVDPAKLFETLDPFSWKLVRLLRDTKRRVAPPGTMREKAWRRISEAASRIL